MSAHRRRSLQFLGGRNIVVLVHDWDMDIPPNGQYKAELSGGPNQGEIVTLTANGTELLPEFVAELKDGSHVHYVLDGATQVFNALTVSYVYADELDLNKPEIL